MAEGNSPLLGQPGGYPFDQHRLGTTSVGVNLANGGLLVGEDDLVPALATYGVAYSRYYNSLTFGSTELGPGWSLSVGPDVSLTIGTAAAALVGPSGYTVTFTRDTGGEFVAPAGYEGALRANPDGTYSADEPSEGQTLVFDAQGQLITTIDGGANEFTVQDTSAAGRTVLSSYGTAAGQRINVSYDGSSRLIEIDDPASNHRHYGYDAQNRLSTYQSPTGIERYSYDSAGHLDSLIEPDGSTLGAVILPNGQVVSLTFHRADGTPDETWQYAYAPGLTTVTYPDGTQQSYEFDADGQLLEDSVIEDSAVEYYADAEGISAAQARADLALQAKASPVDTTLISQLGDDYVGMGFDAAAGRVKLKVTSAASQSRVDAALSTAGIAGATDVAAGGPSFATLLSAKASIGHDLAALFDAGQVRLGIDPAAGAVLIEEANDLTAAEQSTVQAARDAASVPTTVAVQDQPSLIVRATSCVHSLCDRPLRGGQHIDTPVGGGTIENCSAGFIARSTSDRKPYVLTAGHCVTEAPSLQNRWYSAIPSEWQQGVFPYAGRSIGRGHSGYFAGHGNVSHGSPPDGDAGLIDIEPGSFWNHDLQPIVVVYGTRSFNTRRDERYPILRTGGTPGNDDPRQKNFVVCTGGAPVPDGEEPQPAERCGKVTAVAVDPHYDEGPDPSGLAEFETCGRFSDTGVIPGASGSPVYKHNTAYGIISGSDQEDCHGFYEGINRAKHTLGVSITFRAG